MYSWKRVNIFPLSVDKKLPILYYLESGYLKT